MGIGATKLLLVLAVVIVVFGTKRLRTMGGDIGGAIHNFRTAIKSDGPAPESADERGGERVG